MNPKLSRRAAAALQHAGGSLSVSQRDGFVDAVWKAESFADLAPKWQALLLELERR